MALGMVAIAYRELTVCLLYRAPCAYRELTVCLLYRAPCAYRERTASNVSVICTVVRGSHDAYFTLKETEAQ